jgi:Arc/MetJ-type ribon-helix-helix transcriptional regulator
VNVWIPGLLSTAIDQAVESGRFKSREAVITHALEAMFAEKDRNVVT